MKKQLDHRWKQIDKFESSVKTYAETKATWRRKFSAKEGELEAIKVRYDFFGSDICAVFTDRYYCRRPMRIWLLN
jgi:hypothetical protein